MNDTLGKLLGDGCSVLAGDRLRLLETLVGHLTDGVVITEAKRGEAGWRILWVNGAVERMTGYELGELVGNTPRILQGPRTDREVTARMGRALEACQPVEAELVNYRKDGTPFWTDIRISPVFGEDGRCTHFVALKRDATARKGREDLDRRRMMALELIAEAAPLADVLEQIAAMVESQSPQAAIAVERIEGASGLGELALADAARAQLLEGRPIVCPALTGTGTCPAAGAPCVVPCALYPIRGRSGGALLGVVSARALAPSLLGDFVLQAMSEAAQLAEIAFQRDADRRHLEHLARYDPLTNLPNRMLLSERLEQQVAGADRRQSRFALAVLDLDRFKTINDAFGHAAGDFVLRESAERLQSSLRACDTLARIGGDEFVLLLQDVASREAAECAVRRIVAMLERPFRFEGHDICVEASFGLALYPDDSNDTRELFHRADLAMYAFREDRAKPDAAAQTERASASALTAP
ncbi:MAG: diguanylate cyclase [Candidatus Baltobacteraceae bacterium]